MFAVFCQESDATPTVEISVQSMDNGDPSETPETDGPEPEVIDVNNLPPFPVLRNMLLDSDNEVETFNGYHYDKPDIPFEDTNVNPVEVDGYSYPKPSNPLTYPDRANNVIQEEDLDPRNIVPESEQGPPVIDLPDDSIRILDDEVADVEDEAPDATDASDANQ